MFALLSGFNNCGQTIAIAAGTRPGPVPCAYPVTVHHMDR